MQAPRFSIKNITHSQCELLRQVKIIEKYGGGLLEQIKARSCRFQLAAVLLR